MSSRNLNKIIEWLTIIIIALDELEEYSIKLRKIHSLVLHEIWHACDISFSHLISAARVNVAHKSHLENASCVIQEHQHLHVKRVI